jgi:protein-arginine kinase activator protein McsA
MAIDDKAEAAEPILTTPEEEPEEEFEVFSLSELKEMLQKAVDQEDYEKASRIRDEIQKRGEDF